MFTNFRMQFGSGSELQTDEVVVINTPIPGTSPQLYSGHFCGLTNDSIVGTTSTIYGVYSAAGLTGVRLTVIKQGTPSGNTVFLDQMNGSLIADHTCTVYMTYPFYGRLFHHWEQSSKIIDLGGKPVTSDTLPLTIYTEAIVKPEAFTGMSVQWPLVIDVMSALSTSVTLALCIGGVSKATLVTIHSVDNASTTFSSRVKFPAGSVLTITSDAPTVLHTFGPVISLFRG